MTQLQGSEKQIAWAETIRTEFMNRVQNGLDNVQAALNAGEGNEFRQAFFRECIAAGTRAIDIMTNEITAASAYIDHRGVTNPYDMLMGAELTPEMDKESRRNVERRWSPHYEENPTGEFCGEAFAYVIRSAN